MEYTNIKYSSWVKNTALYLLLDLSGEEKTLVEQSLLKLTDKLDILVETFFNYFLQSDVRISNLFQNTPLNRRYNMFNVAIGTIITNIDNPDLLQTHLDQLINKHRLYGVIDEYIQFFTSSMSRTFSDIFGKDDPVVVPWLKVINSVMLYFHSKI